MKEKYESLSLATLKDLAKARGLKGISTMRKPELIERMLKRTGKNRLQKMSRLFPEQQKRIPYLQDQSLWQQKKQKIREVFLHRREEKHQPDPVPLYGVILSTAAIIMAEMKMQDARTVIMGKTDRRTS